MKITLQDIASDTGYSASTVSRVLNGSDKYSDETRNAVLEAAHRLNYLTNKIRPTEHTKSYLNIALLTDFHEGEFYASFFYGYVQASKDMNLRISLISLRNPKEMIKDYIGIYSDQYFDGAIIFLTALKREDYEAIAADIPEGFPVISNALIESPVLTTITFDGYSGGHMAASHFNKKGYKKVGIIKGPQFKAESRFRFNGFADYVNQTNDMTLVMEYLGNFNYESGVQAYKEYRKLADKPEAIFISNDLMTHGFIDSAKADGLDIPGQIAVLSYDDLPMSVHSHPKISSVKTDFQALAKASLESLIERKENPQTSSGILSLVPVSLNVRESS
jgi:DNA-binding LacI/PurR family transcriptional regulator